MNKPSELSDEVIAERTDPKGNRRQLLRVPRVEYRYIHRRPDEPDFNETAHSDYSAHRAVAEYLEEDE